MFGKVHVMTTRDLGTHVVEFHEEGMLSITGEGTRITLSPHEALDFLNWLIPRQKAIREAAHNHALQQSSEMLSEMAALTNDDSEDRDAPIDEV
jgi:hypothetical protein